MKKLRKDRGKTLLEVATALELTVSAYSNYEQGIREPSYDILIKICRYFDVSADYLLGIEE